jgi:hypothetical protein
VRWPETAASYSESASVASCTKGLSSAHHCRNSSCVRRMERKVGNLVGRPKAWRGRERNRRERKSAVQAEGSSDGARGEEGAAEVDEDLRMLLRVLPHDLCEQARSELHLRDLIEVVLDLGRRPSIRFPTGEMPLRDDPVSRFAQPSSPHSFPPSFKKFFKPACLTGRSSTMPSTSVVPLAPTTAPAWKAPSTASAASAPALAISLA